MPQDISDAEAQQIAFAGTIRSGWAQPFLHSPQPIFWLPTELFGPDPDTVYVFGLVDLNRVIFDTNSTFIVPPNSQVPWPIGAVLWFEASPTGSTISAGAGVTVLGQTSVPMATQVAIYQVSLDVWMVS